VNGAFCGRTKAIPYDFSSLEIIPLAEWRNERHSALQKNRSLPIFKQDVGRNETARRYGFVESVMRAHSDKKNPFWKVGSSQLIADHFRTDGACSIR
jgi:hypothetical protein